MFAIFWAADNKNTLFFDLEEYLKKHAFLGLPLGILR
jgi:hypothetical protein